MVTFFDPDFGDLVNEAAERGRRQRANQCPDTSPHGTHEWYGTPASIRRQCSGVEGPDDRRRESE